MGIVSLIRWLFRVDAAAPSDAMKLDGTTEATLARSLSALPPNKQGWITFAEAREFLALAPKLLVKTSVSPMPLAAANETLGRLRRGQLTGAAVLIA